MEENGNHWGRHHFDAMFQKEDPWNYKSLYEQTKYDQTFSLLSRSYPRVLEVGCAEGLFTERLAVIADNLLAIDISSVALSRASARLSGHPAVEFKEIDIFYEEIPGKYDLIVCSEILYYAPDKDALRSFLGRLIGALQPGGQLLMVHAKDVVDDPAKEGFDFGHPFGVYTISEITQSLGAHLEEELEAPLYLVQRFGLGGGKCDTRKRYIPMGPISPQLAALASGLPTRSIGQEGKVIPVLHYELVGNNSEFPRSRDCSAAKTLAEHMKIINENQYLVLSLKQFHELLVSEGEISRPAVLLIFEGGYQDFIQDALPVLQQYGFPATLFVPYDMIGGDQGKNQESDYFDSLWASADLKNVVSSGIEIGLSINRNFPLNEWLQEIERNEFMSSFKRLREEFHQKPCAFYYPHGEFDHLIADCAANIGFDLAFTSVDDAAILSMDPMRLPCIKSADKNLAQFVRGLTTVIEGRS